MRRLSGCCSFCICIKRMPPSNDFCSHDSGRATQLGTLTRAAAWRLASIVDSCLAATVRPAVPAQWYGPGFCRFSAVARRDVLRAATRWIAAPGWLLMPCACWQGVALADAYGPSPRTYMGDGFPCRCGRTQLPGRLCSRLCANWCSRAGAAAAALQQFVKNWKQGCSRGSVPRVITRRRSCAAVSRASARLQQVLEWPRGSPKRNAFAEGGQTGQRLKYLFRPTLTAHRRHDRESEAPRERGRQVQGW